MSTGGTELGQDSYYMAARSRMSMRMLESGSLAAVQAFLLMVCPDLPIASRVLTFRAITSRSETDQTPDTTTSASRIAWLSD